MTTKAGYVSIIGKPNVGKSTLMNSLIGGKISIVTSKPQTTRKRIIGILSEEDYQVVFLDTPGILNPEYLLQEKMLSYIYASAKDSDIILFMIDMGSDPTGSKTFDNEKTNEILGYEKIKKILVLNKIDLSNKEQIDKTISEMEGKNIFEKIIPISAGKKFNTESVMDAIIELLPEHPKYYSDDQLSDENERFFVSEILREKILELYHDEVPFSTEVLIEEFKERESSKHYIRASIIVERESQKPIILGAKGSAIKRLGQVARKAIEEFLQHPVYLELFVKVKEKWRSDPNMLKSFGYDTNDE
jgi:GTPase